MTIEWTEKHRREALRRTYEIAAELSANDEEEEADTAGTLASVYCRTLQDWLAFLALRGLSAARLDREVARVDALATGLWCRRQTERVYYQALGPDGLVWGTGRRARMPFAPLGRDTGCGTWACSGCGV